MNPFDLSIVLPTCDRADLLSRCLRSLRAGVKCRHEVIVIDGASTDDTAKVLALAQTAWGESLRIIRAARVSFVPPTKASPAPGVEMSSG